jgi:peroxiredoxin Q/BCP
MKLNEKVDDFTLKGIDEKGEEKTFSLYDFKGKNLIVYFYPKDNTPGCTQEACDFRDNINRLTSKAIVLGISPDSVESHKKFKKDHDLNFILLSDPDKTVIKKFGALGLKNIYGKITEGVIRSTFLIYKDGILRHEWKKVKVQGHVDEVLDELGKL